MFQLTTALQVKMFEVSEELCRFALLSVTNCSSRRKRVPHAQAEGVGLSRVQTMNTSRNTCRVTSLMTLV